MPKALKTSFKQIRRTPYQALAAVLILTLTFFALSIFTLLLAGSDQILKHFESTPSVIAFFEKGKDLTQDDISRIKTELESTGKLADFRYVSTKEAERIYKEKNVDDPMLNELVDYKILPPSIEISASEISALPQLKAILEKEPLVQDIAFFEDVVNQFSNWVTNIRYIGIGIVGFLIVLSVLILMIIISLKIKNKRREIEIMRLLGASKWYINAPFLFEGVIYGILGALFGWLISFTVLQYTTPFLIDWLKDILTFPVPFDMLLLLLSILAGTGAFLGAFSSLLSVNRFSKK
jgi:cell division transport system permease protein